MASGAEITVRKTGSGSSYAGGSTYSGKIIARGTCPFCGDKSAFRQIGTQEKSRVLDRVVAVRCDGCRSIVILRIENGQLYPAPEIDGVNDLPDSIGKYYQEALRCIASDAPNGAVTLFRKVIHAIAIHYDIAEIDDNISI